MKKQLYILIMISVLSCRKEGSVVSENISLQISVYEDDNKTKVSVLPVLKVGSELLAYQNRFDYLLMNIPEIHRFEKIKERDSINKLYPDTVEIKRLYLNKYCQDKMLVKYFEEAYAPIKNPDMQRDKTYSADELMEVASKFFYCDQVNPDTTVQTHVCIGLNGMKEARWTQDYTLLAAFCFEAIFNDLNKEGSQLRAAFYSEKELADQQFKKNITTLEKYLEDVKLDLFNRMKKSATLKETLLSYYESNKNNLPFAILK